MDNCTSTRNNHSCKFVCKVGKKSREQSSNVLLNLHASELYVTKEHTKMVITKINFLFEIYWPNNIFLLDNSHTFPAKNSIACRSATSKLSQLQVEITFCICFSEPRNLLDETPFTRRTKMVQYHGTTMPFRNIVFRGNELIMTYQIFDKLF